MKVIPATAFKQHKGDLADLEAPPHAPSFWLDNAWLEFHTALRGMAKPLCLAISGDRPVFGPLDGGLVRAVSDDNNLDDWDDENDDGDGDVCYFGYASPALVKRLDVALRQLPDDKLLAAIKSAGWPCKKGDERYYVASFGELRKAYRTAAKVGAAVKIVIA